MTTLKENILNKWARRNLKLLEKKCDNPEKQYKKNWNVLQKIAKQEIFIKQKKAGINGLRALPLTDYSDYSETFRKTLKSKKNSLNGEDVKFWINTSGSSGIPKLFPVTNSLDKSTVEFSKYRVSLLIKAFKLYTTDPEIVFVIPGESKPFAPHLPIGEIGYYHYQNSMPKWVEDKFIFSKELYKNKALFDNWHLTLSLLSDCSGITTSIPVRIYHFLNQINAERDEIRQQLLTGSWPKNLSPYTNQKRIDYIVKILEKPIHSVKALWPNLQFICSWKAGQSCSRQLNELQANYDFEGIRFIDQIYNASEGIFNIPFLDEIGGPINLFGIILEFYQEETNQFFWPWELKKDEIYEVVLTNSTGLIRYRTYDKIICTGYYKKTAKIAFHSRALPEISLGWGIVREEELEKALIATGIEHFSLFYFEINEKGSGLNLISATEKYKEKIKEIEQNLIKFNPNYGVELAEGNFTPMQYKQVSEEWFKTKMLENPNVKRLLLRPR